MTRTRWAPYALFLLLAVVGPFVDAFWHSLLTLVFFYAFLGLAWNLMMGVAGLLSLGHALYVGIGAYTTAVLAERLGLTPWIGLPAGALLAAAIGAALTWLTCRFSVRGIHFALLTIAFAELARVVFDNWPFVGATGGFFLKAIDPATNTPLLSLRGNALFFYAAFLVLMVAGYFLVERLMRSRWGLLWRSIRDDEDAARALGVPALRCKVIVVAISAAMTALAGGLFGLMQGSLFPDSVMGLRMSIELLIAPIIGGLGTLFGPILGAAFVVPLMELSNHLGQRTGVYGVNTLLYGLVVLAVIAFMPEGIGPRLARWIKRKEPARAGGR
jgi:branched-chain amino acid transport system permease protein